ncbi:hypothetical protein V1227_30840 [Lentzea sp. DG1S-22]|uniref:hypothetical protein n=1 Tax=Lentzea sp. DG1S-22 TaxID=3108822 RepID=UPI002E76219F|nr:hypothetical protein [Lentzea sp. DG1S-22]WVH79398.1 hypothetical protein V1227_30840 [Lentzea sp. DG1S-22]
MTLTALDDVVRKASHVRFTEVGTPDEFVEVGVDDELRAALAVESSPGGVCACRGDVRFEFLGARREVLAAVVLHHGITLAWNGWHGHAVLSDGEALRAWLRRRDTARPADEDWVAAIPPALRGLTRRMLRPVRWTAGSRLLAQARTLLGAVDPVTGTLQLLAWRGSGGAQHAEIPALLLLAVPLSKIGTALKDPRADERHYAGAVRHLLGADGRERSDAGRLPRSVRMRLADAAGEIPEWAEPLLRKA